MGQRGPTSRGKGAEPQKGKRIMAKVTAEDRAIDVMGRIVALLTQDEIKAVGNLDKGENIPASIVHFVDQRLGHVVTGRAWELAQAECQRLAEGWQRAKRLKAIAEHREAMAATGQQPRALLEWDHPEDGLQISPLIHWAGGNPVVVHEGKAWVVPAASVVVVDEGPILKATLLAKLAAQPLDEQAMIEDLEYEGSGDQLDAMWDDMIEGQIVAEKEMAERLERYQGADVVSDYECPDCGKVLSELECQIHSEHCPGPRGSDEWVAGLRAFADDLEAQVASGKLTVRDALLQAGGWGHGAGVSEPQACDEPMPWVGREQEARQQIDQAIDWLEYSLAGGAEPLRAIRKAARWLRQAMGYMDAIEPDAQPEDEAPDRVASLPLGLATELKALEFCAAEIRELFLLKASQPDQISHSEARTMVSMLRAARNEARGMLTEYGWEKLSKWLGEREIPEGY